jgi:hypothetical protein
MTEICVAGIEACTAESDNDGDVNYREEDHRVPIEWIVVLYQRLPGSLVIASNTARNGSGHVVGHDVRTARGSVKPRA